MLILQGANSPLGIGRATAHQYAESGARAIYICDFDGSNLETHKKEINQLHPNVEIHTRQFDASDEGKVKAVVDDAMERYGRLDVFFANAGITGPNVIFTDIGVEDFMNVYKINTLRSVFFTWSACRSTSTPYPQTDQKLTASSWPPNTPRQP